MTNFPTSLDSLTNPTASSKLNNPSHSDQHINANDAIEAMQKVTVGPLVFNVKGYGATGDGSTDDTAAIQAAIDAAEAAGGGKAFLPPGDFLHDTAITVPAKVELVGAGPMASILRYTGTSYGLVVGDAAASAVQHGCAVENLRVLLTVAGGNGIKFVATTGAVLRDVNVERTAASNSTGVGVAFAVSSGGFGTILTRLERVYVSHVKTCYQTQGAAGKHTTIIGDLCTAFSDIANAGVGLDINASNGDGHVWTGCDFESCATGIALTSSRSSRFVGCRFENNTTDVTINATATDNNFIGCVGLDTVTNSAGTGFDANDFIGCSTSAGVPVRNDLVGQTKLRSFAASDIPLTVQGHPSQSSSLLKLVNSANQSQFEVNQSGTIVQLGGRTVKVHCGSGTPESVVTATVGSLFLRVDGGVGTCLYVKESGTGNTGWVAK